jgi:hypothetical protein
MCLGCGLSCCTKSLVDRKKSVKLQSKFTGLFHSGKLGCPEEKKKKKMGRKFFYEKARQGQTR